jgi:hypothetical protein
LTGGGCRKFSIFFALRRQLEKKFNFFYSSAAADAKLFSLDGGG